MKYVYVMLDPLLEQVICVHDRTGVVCSQCEKVLKERIKNNSNYCYYPTEYKKMIKTNLKNK